MSEQADISINLRQIAHEAMLEEDFLVEPPPADRAEIKNNADYRFDLEILDLRSLLWSSIDNEDSRDLDQIEVAEKLADGQIRVRVGIADVDALAAKNSALDVYAAQNTTSVYTGIQTFPMLPRELSEDLTSLVENEDRLAVVVDFTVARDGDVRLNGIYRALTRNRAKLDYDSAAAFLNGAAGLPIQIKGLAEQIRLQDEAADRLREVRIRAGALEFGSVEATTKRHNGEVFALVVKEKNQARYLIENLMITTNVLMAQFLENHGFPALERIVRRPERWQRIVELAAAFGEFLPPEPDSQALANFLEKRRRADPARFPDLSLSVVKLIGSGDYTVSSSGSNANGHFGLAVNDYTHSTAPNRRYADLIAQRLVKAAIAGAPAPYSVFELEKIAARCNERQTAARKVERKMRKIVAAQVLSKRLGEVFAGIVTGVSRKGVFVRLVNPPAEGKIVVNETGIDVGDHVAVRLVGTDARHGFIDFERI